MTNLVVDLFTVYQLVKRLVTPFDHWDAFRLGVIDDKGNILISKAHRTAEQLSSLRLIDVVARNLKRMLAVVPGGSSRLASIAAAMMLMKEGYDQFVNEDMKVDHQITTMLSEEMVSAGAGAIDGIGIGPRGEPGVTKKQQYHYKIGNRTAVFPIDTTRYYQTMWGKHPRKTYKTFVSDDDIGNAIREYGRTNTSDHIALQDKSSGAMQWLVRRNAPIL